MKEVLLFILRTCPYSQQALSYQQSLLYEYPEFANVPLRIVAENEEPELANSYDYYYVPTYFVGNKKVHEGPVTKEDVKKVFEEALKA